MALLKFLVTLFRLTITGMILFCLYLVLENQSRFSGTEMILLALVAFISLSTQMDSIRDRREIKKLTKELEEIKSHLR